MIVNDCRFPKYCSSCYPPDKICFLYVYFDYRLHPYSMNSNFPSLDYEIHCREPNNRLPYMSWLWYELMIRTMNPMLPRNANRSPSHFVYWYGMNLWRMFPTG